MAGLRELEEETGVKVFDIPLDNGAYVHPQSDEVAFKQYCQSLQNISIAQKNLGLDAHVTPTVAELNKHNAFLAPHSIEVFCPQEHCQLIVRMVIVDKPFDQTPQLQEGHKCENWYWVKWSDVQQLAQYHHQRNRAQQFQHLPFDLKAVAISTRSPISTIQTQIKSTHHDHSVGSNSTSIHNPYEALTSKQLQGQPPSYSADQPTAPLSDDNQQSGTVDASHLLTPLPPKFSKGCILQASDQLFGPMQALAISGFDPTTASAHFQ